MQRHILVVDDEPHFRFAAAIVLRKSGYRVSEAGDGQEALELIACSGNPPDLIVVDVLMPGMSGIELLGELRRIGISIPVLAISGFNDKALVTGLLQSGCSQFLGKPFPPEEMVRKIDEILG